MLYPLRYLRTTLTNVCNRSTRPRLRRPVSVYSRRRWTPNVPRQRLPEREDNREYQRSEPLLQARRLQLQSKEDEHDDCFDPCSTFHKFNTLFGEDFPAKNGTLQKQCLPYLNHILCLERLHISLYTFYHSSFVFSFSLCRILLSVYIGKWFCIFLFSFSEKWRLYTRLTKYDTISSMNSTHDQLTFF